MRLLSATATSGVLELVTDEGSFRMEIDHGWTAVPPIDQLDDASRVLTCSEGAFRFEPGEVSPIKGPSSESRRVCRRRSVGAAGPRARSDDRYRGRSPGLRRDHRARPVGNPSEYPPSAIGAAGESRWRICSRVLRTRRRRSCSSPRSVWWRPIRDSGVGRWRMNGARRGWEVRQIGKKDERRTSESRRVGGPSGPGCQRRGNEERWLDLVRRAREAKNRLCRWFGPHPSATLTGCTIWCQPV